MNSVGSGESAARSEPQAIDWADRLAIVYILLPIFLFFTGWFRPVFAVPLCLVLACSAWPVFVQGGRVPALEIEGRTLIFCAGVCAVVWTFFGGAGHFLFANSDWPVRDAVLRDLVVYDWPVKYEAFQGNDLILRCPIAYYLPAALVAKVVGLASADKLLFAWTVLGVFIFMVLALSKVKSLKQGLVVISILIFFSGADALGFIVLGLGLPPPPQHLEWWAVLFQYSSNTTQLFWVPNHALSGWLITALLFKHRLNPTFISIAPAAVAATPLWSPLITIGLAPFMLYALWEMGKDNALFRALPVRSVLCSLLVFAVLAIYILMDGGKVRSGWVFNILKEFPFLWAQVLGHYIEFVFLEFGIIVILLRKMSRGYLTGIIGIFLTLLPLYTFGPGNDLPMRGSIPALMLICLACAYAVTEMRWTAKHIPVAEIALVTMLVIGAITPIYEFSRSVMAPRWQPDLKSNLVKANHGIPPPHYIGALKSPIMKAMLKPVPVEEAGK